MEKCELIGAEEFSGEAGFRQEVLPNQRGAVEQQNFLQPLIERQGFLVQEADCISFLQGLPDESVDLIVTDPAYSGMNRHLMLGRGRIVGCYRSNGERKWFAEFLDDPDTYRVFLGECRRVLRNNRHIYIMFDSFSLLSLGHIVREFFDVKNLLVWDKVNLGMGHYFRRRHEHIIFASKGYRKLRRRDLPDVWQIKRIKGAYPTQKPVELFERMIEASAEPGFVVCDPFVGSGSSAVAALRLGCSFVGADISPKAVALARERCIRFLETGIDPLEVRNSAEQIVFPKHK